MFENVLTTFLKNRWDIEDNQYDNYQDEINEAIIPNNFLSQADMNLILDFDINKIKENSDFENISALFDEIINCIRLRRWNK